MLFCRLEWASRAAKLDGRRPPRSDMAHLLQARASMNRGKATGLDRVAPEMIKALPWKALRDPTNIGEKVLGSSHPICGIVAEKHHYLGVNTCKTNVHRAHWPSGPTCFKLYFSTDCMRNRGLREGRGAPEIAAMMRIMAASAHEWWKRHATARSFFGSEAGF